MASLTNNYCQNGKIVYFCVTVPMKQLHLAHIWNILGIKNICTSPLIDYVPVYTSFANYSTFNRLCAGEVFCSFRNCFCSPSLALALEEESFLLLAICLPHGESDLGVGFYTLTHMSNLEFRTHPMSFISDQHCNTHQCLFRRKLLDP